MHQQKYTKNEKRIPFVVVSHCLVGTCRKDLLQYSQVLDINHPVMDELWIPFTNRNLFLLKKFGLSQKVEILFLQYWPIEKWKNSCQIWLKIGGERRGNSVLFSTMPQDFQREAQSPSLEVHQYHRQGLSQDHVGKVHLAIWWLENAYDFHSGLTKMDVMNSNQVHSFRAVDSWMGTLVDSEIKHPLFLVGLLRSWIAMKATNL